MDWLRKQLRRRLELERLMGVTALPRLRRLPATRRAASEADRSSGAQDRAGRPAGEPSAEASESARRLGQLERETVAHCAKCLLHRTRSHVVFGEGNPNAALVFVGEAPGADEDRQGRPFVGRAGQLLNDIITKGMGLRRDDVYIANVLKCRPPENRTPQPDEMADCLPFLLRQLEIIRPRVIVALGAVAAQGLLQTTESIGRLRGHVHEFQLDPMGQPIPVIVTYHPAYLLRNYSVEARSKVWQDIQQAMAIAGIPIPKKKDAGTRGREEGSNRTRPAP